MLLYRLCPGIYSSVEVALMDTTDIPSLWNDSNSASEPLMSQTALNELLDRRHLKMAVSDSSTVLFCGCSKNIPACS